MTIRIQVRDFKNNPLVDFRHQSEKPYTVETDAVAGVIFCQPHCFCWLLLRVLSRSLAWWAESEGTSFHLLDFSCAHYDNDNDLRSCQGNKWDTKSCPAPEAWGLCSKFSSLNWSPGNATNCLDQQGCQRSWCLFPVFDDVGINLPKTPGLLNGTLRWAVAPKGHSPMIVTYREQGFNLP